MTEAVVEERAAEAARAAEQPPPSFPDLVWAHYRWDAQRRRPDGAVDPQLEASYRRTLAQFERAYGELVSVYWSGADASAVGVTVKRRGRLSFGDCEVRFHRATDWVTRRIPGVAEALDQCDTLAMKAREVLRSTSERIAIQWIFSVASHLLGVIERTNGDAHEHEHELHKVTQEAHAELHRIDAYYDRAGMKAGRIVYAEGMVVGAAALASLAFLSALVLWAFNAYDAHSTDIRTFFACFAAGALGAIVSVMSRMASERNKLVVDYEVGRFNLLLLGAFRPFVGTIFGLALYFAVKGGLLQVKPIQATTSFYWYTVLSFLAGFSERFTKVLIDSAEHALPAPPRPQPKPAERATRQPQQPATQPPSPS